MRVPRRTPPAAGDACVPRHARPIRRRPSRTILARRHALRAWLACTALLACERPAERGDAALARMIVQPRADAFDASAFFADSAVLRMPPEGTVPRHRSPLGSATRAVAGRVAPTDRTASPAASAALDTTGIARDTPAAPTAAAAPDTTGAASAAGAAGDTATVSTSASATRDTASLPMVLTTRLLARGRDRFGIYCAVCHGANADGNSIVATNMHDPAPPSLIAGPHASHSATHVYDVITSGIGRMPSYAAELDPEDRWAVVAWVLQLRGR